MSLLGRHVVATQNIAKGEVALQVWSNGFSTTLPASILHAVIEAKESCEHRGPRTLPWSMTLQWRPFAIAALAQVRV